MSNSQNNNSENNPNKAEEPEASYAAEPVNKNITISSLEELEELNRAHTRDLTSPQRLEYLRKLNQNLYGVDLSHQQTLLKEGKIIIRKKS
jgi:hypothetical protein